MKAVLTGASGDIGKALFAAMADAGYQVACCSRSQPPSLADLLEEKGGEESGHVMFELDLTDDNSIKGCLAEIEQWAGKQVAALVNCAGIAHGGLVNMTRMEDLKEVFQVNYFGQVMLTQRVSRYMQRNGGGRIVNIASHAGLRGDRGTLAYATSKAAMIHATRIMAAEYAAQGITVNAVAPSVVDTAMAKQMDEKVLQRLLEQTNTGRLVAIEEVVSLVLYLLRDAPASFTGEVLKIDGSVSL